MIPIKTKEEIEIMRAGGKILSDVLGEVLQHVKPGVSELELDAMAEDLIRKHGAEPGFKKVKGYGYSICVSPNDVVVHGIPTVRKLKEGDIFGVDCGVYYKGFHTDMSETLRVSTINKNAENDKFLEIGRKALEDAIKIVRAGNHVGDISKTIQEIVEGAGYSVVRSLVGHGVGRLLHEEPEVPGFLALPIEKTPLLLEGMVIAIEVIYNMGKKDVAFANQDGWTIKTADGRLSGLFERTVAVTSGGPIVLTA